MSHPAAPAESRRMWDPQHPACAEMQIVDAADGRVTCTPRRDKVAIVGFASSSRDAAPYDDPSYEIWGLNQLYGYMPRRAERWFEIHLPEIFTADIVPDTDYLAWQRECPIPLYMIDVDPSIPNSVRYPRERVLAHFSDGGDPLRYVTSTPAWMLMLAIEEGFKHIAFYGIDLVVGIEYQAQKTCLEFYLGWAFAKGITVELPKTSALLKSRWLYGYDNPHEIGPINRPYLERLIRQHEERRDAILAVLQGLDGALSYTQVNLLTIPGLSEESRKVIEGHRAKMIERRESVITALNNIDGAIVMLKSEVYERIDLYDKGVG